MDNIKILEVPHSLPLGWDIADQPPPGFSFEKILKGPPPEKTLADLCLSTEQLAVMEIPPRDYLIEPFIMTQSLNMLYAKRGIGKTWAASQMAISVASGVAFFAYNVVKIVPIQLTFLEILAPAKD